MLISEVTANQLHNYVGLVKVVVPNGSANIRTIVQADGVAHARMLLQHLYGASNVLNVS